MASRPEQPGKGRTKLTHVRLDESEQELLEAIAKKLHTSKSEIMRRALHAYSGFLAQLWKE